MNLRILREAEDEMHAAAHWYDEKRPGLGDDFLDCVCLSLESVEKDPERLAFLETADTSREVRRCLVPRFPFTVIYEVRETEVLVLAVAHVRRRPNYWAERSE